MAKRLDGSRHNWYRDRPRPRRHCVRWGCSPEPPPQKGCTAPPIFGPMSVVAKWLGGSRCQSSVVTEVDLGPGNIVLVGGPSYPLKRGTFRVILVGWSLASLFSSTMAEAEASHRVNYGPSSPLPPKKGHSPPIFGPCLLWPNSRPSHLLLSSCISVYISQFMVTNDKF